MNTKLEQFFSENDFDIYEPSNGHQERFLEKLQKPKRNTKMYWFISTACVLIIFSFIAGMYVQDKSIDLKDVSPKMAETQQFYQVSIKSIKYHIEEAENQSNKELIKNVYQDITTLETEYEKLKIELQLQNNQELITYNMIKNFQKRIEILERLLIIIQKQKKTTTPKKNNYEIS